MNLNAKHFLCAVAVQAAAVAVQVQAAPLDGVPMGDFSGFPGSTPDATIAGVGEWLSSASFSAASSQIVGTGADAHVELFQEWPGRGASAAYTSLNATSETEAWKVGADLKWVSDGPWSNKYVWLMDGDRNSLVVFGLNFHGPAIEWSTPTSSGTYTPTANIGADYDSALITYDPVSGDVSATYGGETVFQTTTTAGLNVRTVFFGNFSPSDEYQPGTLHVDNVFAAAVPEPTSAAVMVVGAIFAMQRSRRRPVVATSL